MLHGPFKRQSPPQVASVFPVAALARAWIRVGGADFVVHADPGKGGWAHGTHGMSPTVCTCGPRALHVPCVRCLPWAVLPMEGRADCPQSAAAVQTSSPLFAPPRSSCGARWQPFSNLLAPREEPPPPIARRSPPSKPHPSQGMTGSPRGFATHRSPPVTGPFLAPLNPQPAPATNAIALGPHNRTHTPSTQEKPLKKRGFFTEWFHDTFMLASR